MQWVSQLTAFCAREATAPSLRKVIDQPVGRGLLAG